MTNFIMAWSEKWKVKRRGNMRKSLGGVKLISVWYKSIRQNNRKIFYLSVFPFIGCKDNTEIKIFLIITLPLLEFGNWVNFCFCKQQKFLIGGH